MLAGKIGSRNEKIGSVRVVVAAPAGDSARRQDTLAFLNWKLPRLQEVFPQLPQRLLIVSAGDPMWRGGLSGPLSMFLHSRASADQREPYQHAAARARAHRARHPRRRGKRLDRRRTGRVLFARNAASLGQHQRAALQAGDASPVAVGEVVRRRCSARIRTGRRLRAQCWPCAPPTRRSAAPTGGKASLDDVARKLASERGTVSLVRLQKAAQEVAGRPLRSLRTRAAR